MKKIILKFSAFIFSIILLMMISLGSVLFFRPTWLINPESLKWVLTKSMFLKNFQWQEASIEHDWLKWNKRIFKGHFSAFCLEYERPGLNYKSCFEKISWNFKLQYHWGEGFSSRSVEPIFIRSSHTHISLSKSHEASAAGPPDIWRYWRLFWSPVVPDIDGLWDVVSIKTEGNKSFKCDLSFFKTQKHLQAKALNFSLLADPNGFELLAPKRYPFPKKIDVMPALYFLDVKLTGKVNKDQIPLTLTGALEGIGFEAYSKVDLPLKDDLGSVNFRKKTFLASKAKISLPQIKSSLSRMTKDPYRDLPAPLNAMDGAIVIEIITEQMLPSEWGLMKAATHIDMKGGKQVLNMTVENEIPLNLSDFSLGPILLGIDFKEVILQLPRLSKKSPPPQFFPDKRFQKKPYGKEPKNTRPLDFSVHLDALNEKAMRIRTNLLDEDLRLNFDLFIHQGNMQKGFLSMLPLKTTVFRRPIHVKNARIDFNHPQEAVLRSILVFPLPEYKITLTLEGPVSKPRYHFKSDPPLSQNDIYSVLLFGRPMNDLDQNDKTNAQKTNQILAQGILSLSVLYFFAGSPVEYVGFNPETKKATAQIGLNSKTSLNIGRDQEGVNSSGIRRSLGKGWYLDTTMQSPSSSSSQKNYGVLLERVISY